MHFQGEPGCMYIQRTARCLVIALLHLVYLETKKQPKSAYFASPPSFLCVGGPRVERLELVQRHERDKGKAETRQMELRQKIHIDFQWGLVES